MPLGSESLESHSQLKNKEAMVTMVIIPMKVGKKKKNKCCDET